MAIVVSVILVPRVFTSGVPADVPGDVLVATGAPGSSVLPLQAPAAPRGTSSTVVLTPTQVIPDVPPTTEAPAAAPVEEAKVTVTTEAPSSPTTTEPAPTTTTPAPTTTTAAPPPLAPAPAPAPAPEAVPAALSASHDDGVHEGTVSWYDLPGARPGICAHRTIDKGTVVTVTNVDTGKSITCTVDDRGPYSGDDKVLDLHQDDFSQLAPLEDGVFSARLDW